MSNGLLQSLAVFLPESGLGTSANAALTATVSDGQDRGRFMAAALSREDILRGLPVPPESALFRRVFRRVESAGAMDFTEIAATEESPRERREGVAVEELHRQERRVCGLLNALLAEIAARSSAVAVDTNTQTDEPGRSHKENLGERQRWGEKGKSCTSIIYYMFSIKRFQFGSSSYLRYFGAVILSLKGLILPSVIITIRGKTSRSGWPPKMLSRHFLPEIRGIPATFCHETVVQ